MPDPSRIWTITINNDFSNQTDLDIQYSESVYAFKTTATTAGWTVPRSSDGTTADDTDNWTSAAALGLGAAGTGAWCILRSPAGWLPSSDQVDMLLYINDTAGTPQVAVVRITAGTYSGGNTTTLPTASGVETAALTQGDDFLPWGSTTAGSYLTWASTRGDIMFMVKPNGTNQIHHCVILQSFSDVDGGGRGDYRFGLWARSGTSEVLTNTNLRSATNWRGIDSGGTNADAPESNSTVWDIASWTNGLDFAGEAVNAPIDVFMDIAARGRFIGTLVDVNATTTAMAFGVLDDSESLQTQRRVVLGDGMFYVPTADLPLS